jgi:hypothetical protein
MNFLAPPASIIHPNADMTTEQAEVAGKFVDKLIDLGIALRLKHPFSQRTLSFAFQNRDNLGMAGTQEHERRRAKQCRGNRPGFLTACV